MVHRFVKHRHPARNGGGSPERPNTAALGRGEIWYTAEVDMMAQQAVSRRDETPVVSVLVVDDDEMVRKVVCSLLRFSGYRVLQASNADEALRVFQNSEESIDVMLADIVMPGMNGIDLSFAAKSECPNLNIIVMSGSVDYLSADARTKLEEFDFLAKPFTMTSLLEALQRIGARGTVAHG